MRPVLPDTEGYPRYVGLARGPDYSIENCMKDAGPGEKCKETKPIG